MISQNSFEKKYYFHFSKKTSLPSEILVSCALEFAAMQGQVSSISLNQLTHTPFSPGICFRIPESQIVEAIEEMHELGIDINFE